MGQIISQIKHSESSAQLIVFVKVSMDIHYEILINKSLLIALIRNFHYKGDFVM